MLSRVGKSFVSSKIATRSYKVAVCGASGGIGQPLALLLKLEPKVTRLSLFDVVRTPGVAADISHICSRASVAGYVGMEEIGAALEGADIVVIPAGVPRKPGMTRDDLFNVNASIVEGIATACAKACPKAIALIISNPVNSTVPIFAEVMKKHGVYDKNRVIGVTTLDVVRANTFVAENQGFEPQSTNVPVIGGHAGTTILPLLSQAPGTKFTPEDIVALTNRIQFGGDEVVKAKDGTGSATLSMAYAALRFTSNLMTAMSGKSDVYDYAFVENNLTASPFFSTKVKLGPNGIEEVLPYGTISAYEQDILNKMLPDLIGQVKKGVDFVAKKK
jgi:malate dehydrogenase